MRRKGATQIVGLDIGSSKVCVVIAEHKIGGLEIVGLGTHPCTGVQKGVVVSIDATVDAIMRATEEAEKMARVHIDSANIGLANGFIKGITSQGMLPLREKMVSGEDMERVVDAASSVAIPKDSEILHVLPQEYILDGLRGIKDPIGMQGMRLEVNCYIVITQSASVANLVECCHRSGLEITDVILEPLAAAEAVLTSEERELGTLLIDFGGGTTDVIGFSGGAVVYAGVLPLGGMHVTNDVSRMLNLTMEKAEWLKKRHGHLCIGEVMPGEEVEIDGGEDAGYQFVEQRELCEIVEARVLEVLQIAYEEMHRNDLHNVFGRIVLTGGSASMRGIVELAESVFTGKRVRVGKPQHIGGLIDVVSSPMYSTAVGLVLLGAQDLALSKFSRTELSVVSRAGRWLKDKVGKLIT
ncbi:MAG: cell division protein FtsA [Candidatus Lernaella stagnicola]|nr:cell division protein FtsA [Candidatus Lernaella stagnicola]